MNKLCISAKYLLILILFGVFFPFFSVNATSEPITSWTLDTTLPYKIASHFSIVFSNKLNLVTGSALTYNSHDDIITALSNSSGNLDPWQYSQNKYPNKIIWGTTTGNGSFAYGLGGYEEYSISSHFSDNQVFYTSNSLFWSPTTPLPQRLSKGAATIVGNYIYFAGGWTDEESPATASKKVYYSLINSDGSLGNWNTTTDLPDVIWDHGMVSYGGYIFVLAGRNSTGEIAQIIRAKVNLDGTLGTWENMPSLPGKVRSAGYALVENYVFVVGGYNGSNLLKSVYFTTIDSSGQMSAWQTSTNLLSINHCCGSLAFVNGYLYLTGGFVSGSGYTDLVFKTKLNIVSSKPVVVFLPGIGGSWNYDALIHGQDVANSQWKIPGFIKNYDTLLSTLNNSDLHVYAYDWRKPVSTNADSLYEYAQAFGTKVNLIGHSMGGLIAQKMASLHPDVVDKVITLASPNQGALSTYKIWEGADFSDFPTALSLIAKLYLRTNRNNFDSDVATVQNKIPSLANVLPTFDYLKNASGKPVNSFLPVSDIANLSVIQGGGYDTPRYYTVKPASVFESLNKKWRYGKPTTTEYQSGDNTVLQTVENTLVAATHSEITNNTQTQNKILEILGITGSVSTSILPTYEKAILVTVASPVNFELTTPSTTIYPQDGLIILNNPNNGIYSVKITPVNTGGSYTIYFGKVNGKDISWEEISSSIASGTNIHNFNVDFTKTSLGSTPIQTAQTKSLEIINIIKNFNINTVSKNLLLQDASRVHSGISDLAKQTKQSIYDAKIVSLFKQIDVLITKIKNLKLNTDIIVAKYRLIKADLNQDREDRFEN